METSEIENHTRKNLKKLLIDSAGNVQYTYQSHWIIVNRLKSRYTTIKIVQIILTAISTCGFLASILAGIPSLSWAGGATSAIALSLNLYMLNFNVPESIKDHTDAANELWNVRERYKSLIVDFETLSTNEIQHKRDDLQEMVNKINHTYPGTDSKSFKKAQKSAVNYTFEDKEAEKILHL